MLDKKQPIVIKKVGHGDHGHHGGAWKVAFADFVTAMMAFFMLMWLLGSTGQEQRAGISDYFQNPAGVQGPGGASTSMIKLGGTQDMTPGDTEQHKSGDQHDQKRLDEKVVEKEVEIEKEVEKKRLDNLMDKLKEAIGKSQALKPFKDQLLLDITPDGLRIQIVDKENRPMFDAGSAHLKYYTAEILFELAKFLNEVPNRISITGHTDASPLRREDYSNWELSADRANTARRALIDGGLDSKKIGRVIGLASSVLFDKENPYNPVNRRISIIVMNKAAEEEIKRKEAPPEYDGSVKNNVDLDAEEKGFEMKPLPEVEQKPAPAVKHESRSETGSSDHSSPSPESHGAATAPAVGGPPAIDFSKGTRIELPPIPGRPAPAPAQTASSPAESKPQAAEQPKEKGSDEELPPLGIDFF